MQIVPNQRKEGPTAGTGFHGRVGERSGECSFGELPPRKLVEGTSPGLGGGGVRLELGLVGREVALILRGRVVDESRGALRAGLDALELGLSFEVGEGCFEQAVLPFKGRDEACGRPATMHRGGQDGQEPREQGCREAG